MNRVVVKSKVGSDGVLHLDLPIGLEDADREVQVTVEEAGTREMRATDLLQSDLVGMWEAREDIGDSREFARRLREQAQTRKAQP